MFGQRGEHGLVLLNADLVQAKEFVEQWFVEGKTVEIHGVSGAITHFLIEPFVPHEKEFYFSLVAYREHTELNFSALGGVSVEASWSEAMETIKIPVGGNLSDETTAAALSESMKGVPEEYRSATMEYIHTMFQVFEELDFLTLETNPFTFVKGEGGEWMPIPLDMVAEVDDTAKFKNRKAWADLEFPDVFGRRSTKEESFIEEMDEKTGASLKLTLLNPNGKIWNLVAGGGASVIFADTVADLGCGELLGNYGEYSGAPNEEETYHYARTILDLATRNPGDARTALIIGGGIANFTDVAKTFKGIVHALKEYRDAILAANMHVWVRRAGPNYQSGLKLIRRECEKLGIPVEVFGLSET